MSVMRLGLLLAVYVCTAGALGAQMVWVPYEGNPVFDPGPDGTFDDAQAVPSGVIFQAGSYHMWYNSSGDRGWWVTPSSRASAEAPSWWSRPCA